MMTMTVMMMSDDDDCESVDSYDDNDDKIFGYVDEGDDHYGDVMMMKMMMMHQALEEVQEGDLSFMDGDIIEDDDDAAAEDVLRRRKLMEAYDKTTKNYLDPSDFPSDDEGLEEPSLLDMEGVEEGDRYGRLFVCMFVIVFFF